MKKLEQTVVSTIPPRRTDVLWINPDTNETRYFNNEWVLISSSCGCNSDDSGDSTTSALDKYTYGISWEYGQESPKATRIGNMQYHKTLPIQSNMKGVTIDASMQMKYLNPDNWNETLADNATNYAYVEIPEFYLKSGQDGNTCWVRLCPAENASKIADINTWTKFEKVWVGAYNVNFVSNLSESTPVSLLNTINNDDEALINIMNEANSDGTGDSGARYAGIEKTRRDAREAVNINIPGYRQNLVSYKIWKEIYWLYTVEYANFNCQEEFTSELTQEGYHQGGLGYGFTKSVNLDGNPLLNWVPNGYMNEFGNNSGVKEIPIDVGYDAETGNRNAAEYGQVCSYRGLQNIYGGTFLNLDGIVPLVDDSGYKVYIINNVDNFAQIEELAENTINEETTNVDPNALAQKYANIADEVIIMSGDNDEVLGLIKEFTLGSNGNIFPTSQNQVIDYEELMENISIYVYKYKQAVTYLSGNSVPDLVLVGGGAFSDGSPFYGLGCFNSGDELASAHSEVGFRTYIEKI